MYPSINLFVVRLVPKVLRSRIYVATSTKGRSNYLEIGANFWIYCSEIYVMCHLTFLFVSLTHTLPSPLLLIGLPDHPLKCDAIVEPLFRTCWFPLTIFMAVPPLLLLLCSDALSMLLRLMHECLIKMVMALGLWDIQAVLHTGGFVQHSQSTVDFFPPPHLVRPGPPSSTIIR